MKGFIEVTNDKGMKMILNINHIFRCYSLQNEKSSMCRIDMIPQGYSNYPYQLINVIESYNEIKDMISEANKQ